MQITVQQRWALAEAIVQELRGWQPAGDEDCHLDAVEAVALGRHAEPAVMWSWRQDERRFQVQLSVQDLIEARHYEEDLEPPEAPSARDCAELIALSVWEPHGHPPAAPRGVRWCMDHLP